MRHFLSNIKINLPRCAKFLGIATCALVSSDGYATTSPQKRQPIKYFHDLGAFRSDISIPLTVKDLQVDIPDKQKSTRLLRSKDDERVEPLQLTIEENDERILELANKIAKPSQRLALATYLKNNFKSGEEIPGTTLRLVNLDQKAFQFLDEEAFDRLFSKTHHQILINTAFLRNNSMQRRAFVDQLSPFFSSRELARINRKIMDMSTISLDKDLLPQFARQRVATHTIFRGPNCFHAALAFQSPKLASSTLVNVRREQGYHQDMINYDELWRVLQRSFYEIDPERVNLQYGDMIVFFETKEADTDHVEFKTLRHAATYLLGGFVFAKGSKSANSPYLVRTLGEEWETWTKYTKKLGVKVFRRSLKHVTNPIAVDPDDWVD